MQAMRLYHPEVLEDTEFVVADNHPEGHSGPHLKGLEHAIGNRRRIPFTETGESARLASRYRSPRRTDVTCCRSTAM